MDAREIVNTYYAAWQERAGNMSDVPLAAGIVSGELIYDAEDLRRAMAATDE